jgi:hypothetical protein
MALSVNGQVAIVVVVALNTLCCIQYCVYSATHMQLYVINLHVQFSLTFQCDEQNANMAFHPFVDK